MANKDIRNAITRSGLKFWEVARGLSCSAGTFTCKLRHELPEEEKAKIFSVIAKLSKEE